MEKRGSEITICRTTSNSNRNEKVSEVEDEAINSGRARVVAEERQKSEENGLEENKEQNVSEEMANDGPSFSLDLSQIVPEKTLDVTVAFSKPVEVIVMDMTAYDEKKKEADNVTTEMGPDGPSFSLGFSQTVEEPYIEEQEKRNENNTMEVETDVPSFSLGFSQTVNRMLRNRKQELTLKVRRRKMMVQMHGAIILRNWKSRLNHQEKFRNTASPHRLFGGTTMVKELFVRYLEHVNHPKSASILAANIQRYKLPWATSTNEVDCGVFFKRRIETYMGKGMKFEAGISSNGKRKKAQMNQLRKKYATHILLSDANIMKEQIIKEVFGK